MGGGLTLGNYTITQKIELYMTCLPLKFPHMVDHIKSQGVQIIAWIY